MEYSSFYDYSVEELSEDKFNKLINLGINAEDMLGMLQENIELGLTINDLKPYVFPDQRTLKQQKLKLAILVCFVGCKKTSKNYKRRTWLGRRC